MKVEYIDLSRSNYDQEHRVETLAKIASISYGNESAKDPHKLVKHLFDRGHQSVFEFIRLPYKNPATADFENYGIENSLRQKPLLKTIKSASIYTGIDEELYITWWKESLVTLKVTLPIFIDRQAVRHRQDSRIELSRRYVKPEKVDFSYWLPEDSHFRVEEWKQEYHRMLKRYGRAELARITQPLCLETTYYVMRNFKAAKNFYVRRWNAKAQKEFRDLVEEEIQLIKEQQPEFKGIYVTLVDTYEPVYLLDLRKLDTKERFIKVDYDDPNYYAVFDREAGYFVDDVPKHETYFNIMFGSE